MVLKVTTTIHLVRHGDVENPDSLYYGRLPGFSLNEQGREEASAAGQYLSERPISAIYASPQARAQETARIIHEAVGATTPLVTEPALNEILSPFDGFTQDEMAQREWNFYADVEDGFEQPAHIFARVHEFVHRARVAHAGEEIVAVSHADPIVFYWLWVLGVPLEPENRHALDRYGLSDDYPAKASISSFRFDTLDIGEKPTFSYVRPY